MKKVQNTLGITAILIAAVFLIGCASSLAPIKTTRATLGYTTAVHKELISLPPPEEKVVTAVYKFRDQTGQYKTSAVGMTWSTAVTQGATSMMLKALDDSGWFITLEREGLSNLLNERKIIRSTREAYRGSDGQVLPPLPPLLYGGVILEGGIISYETNMLTGGFGAKYFGLGGSTQFRRDQVTIYLRAVSTQNGKILKTVYTTKSILSRMVDVGLYRYVRVKRLLEVETGLSTNEPPQMCVLEAIEKAVYSLIIEGIVDQLWSLKNPEDIKSPLIQSYLAERGEAEEFVQFDEEGEVISREDLYNAAHVVRRRFGFGFNAAAQLYAGDYPYPEVRPSGDLLIRYGITHRFSLVLNGGAGQLADRDNFETTVAHAELKGLLTLFPRKRWTPYLFLGGSAFNFWVKDKEGTKIKRESEYWGWEPAFVSGIGIEYFINEHIGLNATWNHYFTFTDQLDGILHGKIDDSFWGGRIGLIYYLGS